VLKCQTRSYLLANLPPATCDLLLLTRIVLEELIANFVELLALAFAVYHSVTWFNLTPKALPLQLGEEFVPDAVISGAHFGAWAVLSAAVLYFAGAF